MTNTDTIYNFAVEYDNWNFVDDGWETIEKKAYFTDEASATASIPGIMSNSRNNNARVVKLPYPLPFSEAANYKKDN